MDVTPPQYAQIHPNKTTVDQCTVFALLEQTKDALDQLQFLDPLLKKDA